MEEQRQRDYEEAQRQRYQFEHDQKMLADMNRKNEEDRKAEERARKDREDERRRQKDIEDDRRNYSRFGK
jgi:hypothetical protein